MARRVVDFQPSFSGLNLAAEESQLRPTQLRRAENCRLTDYGAVTKRLGTQRTHASAIGSGNPVLGGYSWSHDTTVQQLAVSNGLLHTGTFSIGMSWTGQAGSLSSTLYPSFAAFYDGSGEVAYIADGGPLNKWNGTALTVNIASTPSVTQIAQHNLRLFGCGATAAPQTLYWSSLADGDDLGIGTGTSGGAIVRTFGQQDLTALASCGDSLLIFHKRGISVFTGYSQDDINIDGGTRGLSSDVGTTAPNSVVRVENVVYFLSDRGFYSADLQRGVLPISGAIEPAVKAVSQSTFNRVLGAHSPATKEIWWYLPDVGVYVYNYRTENWTGPWTGGYTSVVPHSLWTAQNSTAQPIVLCGGAAGFVRQCDVAATYLDEVVSAGTGGSTYQAIAQCHRMWFKDPMSEKALRYIYVTGNTGLSTSAGVSWITRTSAGSATLDPSGAEWDNGTWDAASANWDVAAGAVPQRVHAHGNGTFVDVTLTDDGLSETTFSKVEAEAFELARRF